MTESTKAKLSRALLLLFFFALFCCLNGCGSSGGGSDTPSTGTGTTTITAASLDLSASSTTVKSDDSTTTTITVTALNASNAAVSGVTVTLGADSGILGAGTDLTDSTGKVTRTFSSGGNPINRTATITATSGTVSAQIPVQIVGSTLTMTSTGTQLPDNGASPVILTVTAKDAGSNTVQNAAVAITKTGTGNVTFITPASGVTLANGTFTATVAGAAGGAGTATMTATALGATATTALTITPTLATFSIDQQTLNGTVIANNNSSAMKIGNFLAIQVNAPSPTANVIFATTTGVWDGTSSVVSVPVVAEKATATLTTTQAGVANVQVYDTANSATSDTLTVAMTSGASPSRIDLQAIPTVVPKSVGTTTGSSTLIAMVRDASGIPIGDAPVSFSILNPTSGGETVLPVVALTAATPSGGLALGEARASFVSGSLSSTGNGVQIRASVVGTAVETEAVGTNLTPSGNDAAIVIGGTAGSIAFGRATVLAVNNNATAYILAMSVLVADVNGNPAPTGTPVNLSVWPVAWSTGTVAACAYDADGAGMGTFRNEDVNENLILDTGEDGTRIYYAGGLQIGGGTIDTYLTPTNSAGGTVLATVITDANGLATFNLTYPKDSAIWTIVRIRASTFVQGSETVAQTIFRLAALKSDVDPDCKLSCPYGF